MKRTSRKSKRNSRRPKRTSRRKRRSRRNTKKPGSVLVRLLPDVADRRSYLREVGQFDDSSTFYRRAIAHLEGAYLGHHLSVPERDEVYDYLSRIW